MPLNAQKTGHAWVLHVLLSLLHIIGVSLHVTGLVCTKKIVLYITQLSAGYINVFTNYLFLPHIQVEGSYSDAGIL